MSMHDIGLSTLADLEAECKAVADNLKEQELARIKKVHGVEVGTRITIIPRTVRHAAPYDAEITRVHSHFLHQFNWEKPKVWFHVRKILKSGELGKQEVRVYQYETWELV